MFSIGEGSGVGVGDPVGDEEEESDDVPLLVSSVPPESAEQPESSVALAVPIAVR